MRAFVQRVRAELRLAPGPAVLSGDQVPPDPHDPVPAGAEGKVRQGPAGGSGEPGGEDVPPLRDDPGAQWITLEFGGLFGWLCLVLF